MQQQINRGPTIEEPVTPPNTGPTIGGPAPEPGERPTSSGVPAVPSGKRSTIHPGARAFAILVAFILLVVTWWVFARNRIMLTQPNNGVPATRPRVGLSTPGPVNAPGTNLHPNRGPAF